MVLHAGTTKWPTYSIRMSDNAVTLERKRLR